MPVKLSSLIEIIGALLVLVAAFAADWRLGVALVGVVLMFIGWAADAPEREVPE